MPSGEVEGVDWNAVTAQTGTWVIGREAERLGGGGINHFEDVDTHAICDDLHLVDEANVDRSVDVLQQLGHLSSLGGAYRNNLINGLLVKCDTHIKAFRCMSADHFRDGAGFEVRITRIFTLRRVNEEDILADNQTAFLHARQQLFFGSTG